VHGGMNPHPDTRRPLCPLCRAAGHVRQGQAS
jgi:hypothetical protein